jgi:hypothetical protein
MSGAVHKRQCLSELFALWQKKPNLRLGQLLAQADTAEPVYNISDAALIKAINTFIQVSDSESYYDVSVSELLPQTGILPMRNYYEQV